MTTCNPGQETVPNALISKISIGDYYRILVSGANIALPTLQPSPLQPSISNPPPPNHQPSRRVGGLEGWRVGESESWRRK